MSFPIRCFTCNKIIGAYEQRYNKMIEEGNNPKIVFEKLGINRYCCRRMFLGHVNIGDKIMSFPKNVCKE
jgi:DNA-directed RNA polymerase subunit N